MKLGEASTPPGMRIYAIGDVHGCDELLYRLHQRIEADLAARPATDHRIIHVGDYVDRGPDSAAVVERLLRISTADQRVLCLRGNHDDVLLGFLIEPEKAGGLFLRFGGKETMASYGVQSDWVRRPADLKPLSDRFRAALPQAHVRFLEGLPVSVRFGDYFFCHAGIRPGLALDAQSPQDLTWIREEFLDDRRDHGVVVIHGHTPARAPDIRPNRIGIDTGAYQSGKLTCVVLEGTAYRFL